MSTKCKEFSTEGPPSETQQNACSTNEWKCSNGECINLEFVCDNTQDCVDGSDEDEDFCEKEITSKFALLSIKTLFLDYC